MTHPFFYALYARLPRAPQSHRHGPMTRSFSPNGMPGQNVADYYARRDAEQGLLRRRSSDQLPILNIVTNPHGLGQQVSTSRTNRSRPRSVCLAFLWTFI